MFEPVGSETLDRMYIGENIQNQFSERDYSNYIAPNDPGVLATLATNEDWFQEKPGELKNGLIVGIGAGTVLSLINLYDKDHAPEAIIACDLAPEVVLTGRVVVEAIGESNSSNDLKNLLLNPERQRVFINRVVRSETNQSLRSIFEQCRDKMPTILNESFNGPHTEIDIIKAIKDNWETLKAIVNVGNIAFVLSGITDPMFLEEIKKIRANNIPEGDMVIYLSNAIDHITERGTAIRNNPDLLNFWQRLEPLKDEDTHFVDTNSGALKYRLRIQKNIPIYKPEDFKLF